MAVGTVKWFNQMKGFGFIVPEGGTKDVFVHISEIKKSGLDTLDTDQRVEYEISTHNGREVAINIKLAD